MVKSWVVLDSKGKKVGPLQAKQIQSCMEQGLFLPTDVAHEVGSDEVASIIDIPEIFKTSSAPKKVRRSPSSKAQTTKKKGKPRKPDKPNYYFLKFMLSAILSLVAVAYIFNKQGRFGELEKIVQSSEAKDFTYDFPSKGLKKYMTYEAFQARKNLKEVRRPPSFLSLEQARLAPDPQRFIGPLSFSEEIFKACSTKCQLLLSSPGGGTISALFFKKAHEKKLENKANEVYIRGRIMGSGNKLLMTEVYH